MAIENINITCEKLLHRELNNKDLSIINEARRALKKAYAPYSLFKVGVALSLENESIITGNNQESAVFPNGLCAERVALFTLNSNRPNSKVINIAISAVNKQGNSPVCISPCGACRQAILEQEIKQDAPIRILLDGSVYVMIVNSAQFLLPIPFLPSEV
ncbi:MAG: cytidine deaminase [Bacteroidales bacterium]